MGLLIIDFVLSGTSIPPAEISKITGIIPRTALMRGESSKERDLPRQNLWVVRSKTESNDVGDNWLTLQDELLRNKEIFRQIAQTTMNVRLVIGIDGDLKSPLIKIPPEMSAFAGYVGAMIDIDHLQS